jgi:hypothetical protein
MNESTATPQGWNRPTPAPRQISRAEAIDQQIASYLAKGWRIESRTDHAAVMVKGKRVNHVLHLLLSLVTVGLWLPVWLIVAIVGGEKREHIAS